MQGLANASRSVLAALLHRALLVAVGSLRPHLGIIGRNDRVRTVPITYALDMGIFDREKCAHEITEQA